MPGVQHVTVSPDDAGQRLDRWLRRAWPQLAQGRIERMLRKGELRVDGARVKGSHRLATGETVRVPPIPEGDAPPPPPAAPGIAERDAEALRAAVLFRDDHLIVLNKPPGLPVQGGSGQGGRHVAGLAAALRFGREDDPRLVHRLDRDTSGVLLLARSAAAARALTAAFRSRETLKLYWAVTAGVPSPRAGTVRWGLVKAPGSGGGGERMRLVHPDEIAATEGARRATTDYAVIEAAARRAAWVALKPVTGRTHQLRAHMAALGTPIAGDGKYGGSGQTNEGDGWGAKLGGAVSGKLHLHARRLTLAHPATGRPVTFTAPLPEHMARTFALFGWDAAEAPDDPFAARA